MPRATVYYDFEVNGETVEFEVIATFSPYVPVRLSGHPDTWTPAEGGELDELRVARVHAHTKDGKTTHTIEPCAENLLYELLAADNEGWTISKAESEVEEHLYSSAEEDEPACPEYERDDY